MTTEVVHLVPWEVVACNAGYHPDRDGVIKVPRTDDARRDLKRALRDLVGGWEVPPQAAFRLEVIFAGDYPAWALAALALALPPEVDRIAYLHPGDKTAVAIWGATR